jgi:hypothetical protein
MLRPHSPLEGFIQYDLGLVRVFVPLKWTRSVWRDHFKALFIAKTMFSNKSTEGGPGSMKFDCRSRSFKGSQRMLLAKAEAPKKESVGVFTAPAKCMGPVEVLTNKAQA